MLAWNLPLVQPDRCISCASRMRDRTSVCTGGERHYPSAADSVNGGYGGAVFPHLVPSHARAVGFRSGATRDLLPRIENLCHYRPRVRLDTLLSAIPSPITTTLATRCGATVPNYLASDTTRRDLRLRSLVHRRVVAATTYSWRPIGGSRCSSLFCLRRAFVFGCVPGKGGLALARNAATTFVPLPIAARNAAARLH